MNEITAILRAARLALGMTQIQLSEILGISVTYLNDIEHGRRPLGKQYLQLLPDGIREPVGDAMIAAKEAEIAEIKRHV